MTSSERGRHLCAIRFAQTWDLTRPSQAGQYPEFWKERIDRARAAGFGNDTGRPTDRPARMPASSPVQAVQPLQAQIRRDTVAPDVSSQLAAFFHGGEDPFK